MRLSKANDQISVRIIAGLEVVLFGLDVPEADKDRLLGFKIMKKGNFKYFQLNEGKTFKDSEISLIQDFLWGDYSVDPGQTYEYLVSAVYGTPDQMEESEVLEVKVTTESPDDGHHAVFFNRGVAGSQAYSKHFDKYRRWYKTEPFEEDKLKINYKEYIKPEDVPDRKAYEWLSRGLEEALLGFISKAKDKRYKLRASLYELSYKPAAQAFVDALERGVDVKIIHHSKRVTAYKMRRKKGAKTSVTYTEQDGTVVVDSTYTSALEKIKVLDGIGRMALNTVGEIGVREEKNSQAFSQMLIHRTNTTISHNKFIILLEDDQPVEVWTGSTNLTEGGIFGQSNIGHIVRDKLVAQQYLDYWNKLSEDPVKTKSGEDKNLAAMTSWVEVHNPDLNKIGNNSIYGIFSPRKNERMLQWYADQMANAKESVFFTAAFSMDDRIKSVLQENSQHSGGVFQRYLLLEGINGLMREKYPDLKNSNQNRIAYGDQFKRRSSKELKDKPIEVLTGLNSHVNYVHTKYLLVDALTDNPLVVNGSANFSEASTTKNDENMLVIRGNTRIADLFICDFMRLFNHFKRRNESNLLSDEEYQNKEYLQAGSEWTLPYFTKDHQLQQQRLLFGKHFS